MKFTVPVLAALLLVACSEGANSPAVGGNLVDGGSGSGAPDGGTPAPGLPPLPAPDGQALASPPVGSSRAGVSYDVMLTAADGETIAFTVHEPLQMVGGRKVPLLLNGPGFGMSRINRSMRNFNAPAGTPLLDIATSRQYTDAGYGVVAFDQRGFGQSTGEVTIMDPDRDGRNLIQIVDWMEANLDWAMFRDNNLVLGAYGGSYGGGYQLLLNNIDPRRRLDAIVPSITWNDLSYSLNVGDVPKSGYALALAALGEVSSGLQFDPRVRAILVEAVSQGRIGAAGNSLLRYHSNRYFCDGVTDPGRRTATRPPPVDALLFQGMFDVLFNLNEALANYDCLSASGGDVRLLTYNVGHVLPAGVGLISNGVSSLADAARCGPHLAGPLSVQWFDAKLRREPAAMAAVNALPEHCITISSTGEGVELPGIPVGGATYNLPATLVASVLPVQVPVTLFRATAPTVIAGIPTATLTITNPTPDLQTPDGLPLGVSSDDAIVFVSFGRSRLGLPSNLEVIGDQVRPLRGLGTHVIELHGIGLKLEAGEQLQLLLSAASLPQYPAEVARNPLLLAVRVEGSVQVPVLGDVATLP